MPPLPQPAVGLPGVLAVLPSLQSAATLANRVISKSRGCSHSTFGFRGICLSPFGRVALTFPPLSVARDENSPREGIAFNGGKAVLWRDRIIILTAGEQGNARAGP